MMIVRALCICVIVVSQCLGSTCLREREPVHIVPKSAVIINPDGSWTLPKGATGVDESWSSPAAIPKKEKWISTAVYCNAGHFQATGKHNVWNTLDPKLQLFYYGLYERGLFKRFMEGTEFPDVAQSIDLWIQDLEFDYRNLGGLPALVQGLNDQLHQETGRR